jgi:tetratricopeptide (TPR) repeat protein
MDIVIQQRPNNPLAYFFRGYAKQRLQRYHEAIVDLTKSIDDDPYEDGPGLPVAMRTVFLEKPISP